jgi:pyruvate dehydrogenase E2 component (dihydrolipoamide acetyltransferase)
MVREIILPKLGETMEEGVIGKWLKAEGDRVVKGEPLVEVMTDKANFEVEAPVAGVLRKIVIPASESAIPVKQIIGFIAGSMDEEMPAVAPIAAPARPAASVSASRPVAPGPVAPAGAGVRASPRARKLAADKGVDLNAVTGTGPDGRIVEKDILDASGGQLMPPAADGEALTGLRKVIAERMGASKREAPHFYLSVDVDMTGCVKEKAEGVSLNDMIIKAAAKAISEFPRVNALFERGRLKIRKEVDAAVAVSLEDGLVAPVVRDAVGKSAKDISAVMAGVKAQAKTGKFYHQPASSDDSCGRHGPRPRDSRERQGGSPEDDDCDGLVRSPRR